MELPSDGSITHPKAFLKNAGGYAAPNQTHGFTRSDFDNLMMQAVWESAKVYNPELGSWQNHLVNVGTRMAKTSFEAHTRHKHSPLNDAITVILDEFGKENDILDYLSDPTTNAQFNEAIYVPDPRWQRLWHIFSSTQKKVFRAKVLDDTATYQELADDIENVTRKQVDYALLLIRQKAKLIFD